MGAASFLDQVTGRRVWDGEPDEYGSLRTNVVRGHGILGGPPLLRRFVNHVDRSVKRQKGLDTLQERSPQAYRVYLFAQQGLRPDEIMRRMNLQKSTVYEHLAKARELVEGKQPLPDIAGMSEEERLEVLARYPRPLSCYLMQARGLEIEVITTQLDTSRSTVNRDLAFARRIMGDDAVRLEANQLHERWRTLIESVGDTKE